FQKEQLAKSEKGIFFVDRGFGDTLSYYLLQNLPIPKKELDYVMKTRYAGVFILDFLDFYEQEGRVITKEKQIDIQNKLVETYTKLGYNPVILPFATVSERADAILSKI
ncbi:MAG: ATP-binding protein, partial [archaeon]|nr:ATP-binding protein [archaeon]